MADNDEKFTNANELKAWLINKGVDAEDEEEERASQKLYDNKYNRPSKLDGISSDALRRAGLSDPLAQHVSNKLEKQRPVVAPDPQQSQQVKSYLQSTSGDWGHLTACARLGKEFFQGKPHLKSYADAATACLAENPSQTLGTIKELVELQSQVSEDGVGCFATIFASSGTGKSQLAVSASMHTAVQSVASTRYVNVSRGSSQSFYRPHELLGRTILDAFESLKRDIGPVSESATTICSSTKTEENNVYFGFLHYLLFSRHPDSGNETNWKALRSAIRKRRQRFLFFLDEVPAHAQDQDRFVLVLFIRDILRSLGICPILMSTHTGAENYVENASRGDDFTWVKIIARLPEFKPTGNLHASHAAVFEVSERPLVSTLAASAFGDGKTLSEVVKHIRCNLQKTKPDAWSYSSSLQLMQLFATKIVFGENTYKNAHHIVGKHFGSLIQEESKSLTPAEAKKFKADAKMSFVSGELEPLLYLALVSWDDSCLCEGGAMFPLINDNKAISVMTAFRCSQSLFEPWISIQNDQVNHSNGDLLEVLVHASLTLASLKSDCVADAFLGGVPLQSVLCFLSKLMTQGNFDRSNQLPKILQDLDYQWPMVPALGGSNCSLSSKLCKMEGTNIGFLERPVNSDKTAGFIWKTDPDGNKTTWEIMVECKNRRGGLDKSEIDKIFARVPSSARCALIFATQLNGELYSKTTRRKFDDSMREMEHVAFGSGETSVLVWDTKSGQPYFFEYSLKDEATKTVWKAEEETKLLVVIFLVELVEIVSGLATEQPCNKKRKTASPEDLLQVLDQKSRSTMDHPNSC